MLEEFNKTEKEPSIKIFVKKARFAVLEETSFYVNSNQISSSALLYNVNIRLN